MTISTIICIVIGNFIGVFLGVFLADRYDRYKILKHNKENQIGMCPHGYGWDECPDCRH